MSAREEEILDQQIEISREGFEALEKVTRFCCCGCGLCVSTCPLGSIEFDDTLKKPKLVGECNECGYCYLACPRSFLPLSKIGKAYFGKEKGEEEERLGKFVDLFVARSLTEEIYKRGTPGGTTTAMVHFLMDKGYVDAALLTKGKHPDIKYCLHPEPYIASSPEEVLLSSHSKFEISPVLSRLRELSEHGNSLFVGVPCNIMAFRKLQIISKDNVLRNKMKGVAKTAEKLTENVKFAISINCYLNHTSVDKIYEWAGVQEKDLLKFNELVNKDLFEKAVAEGKDYRWFVDHSLVAKDREVKFDVVRLGELVLPSGCIVCPDLMVSKYADISIGVCAGETGLKEWGWNSVVVRNPKLKKIVDEMVATKKLAKKPILRGHGTRKRKFLEEFAPTLEVFGVKNYLETGQWALPREMDKSRRDLYDATEILGLERLFLAQTIKKKIFIDGTIKALRDLGAYVTTTY